MKYTALSTQKAIVLIVVLAVCYNAILAFINANILTLNFAMVAATELLILAASLWLIYRTGITKYDINEIVLIVFIVFSATLISLINQTIFIDSVRNILIISLFVMLGRRLTFETVEKVAFWVALVVFTVLFVEVFLLSTYVDLFHPASYFTNTRGIETPVWNETGLFGNALSFEGRFSFGLFSGARTSSVFLEQVSLGNFAVILTIFLATFFSNISKNHRYFYILLIVAILISSRSRMATAIVLVAIMLYFLIRYIPYWINLIWLPFSLMVSLILYAYFSSIGHDYSTLGDTLNGRLFHTASLLINMELGNFFATDIRGLTKFADSGLVYLLNSTTIFGLIAVWAYLFLVIKTKTTQQLLLLTLVSIYFYATLSVSGTSVFSIKTASLLWLIVGFTSKINNTNKLVSNT